MIMMMTNLIQSFDDVINCPPPMCGVHCSLTIIFIIKSFMTLRDYVMKRKSVNYSFMIVLLSINTEHWVPGRTLWSFLICIQFAEIWNSSVY